MENLVSYTVETLTYIGKHAKRYRQTDRKTHHFEIASLHIEIDKTYWTFSASTKYVLPGDGDFKETLL